MQDLDEFEVGGPLTWADPLDDSEVTVFNVPWWRFKQRTLWFIVI